MSLPGAGMVWIMPILVGTMGWGFWTRRRRLLGLERYLNGHPGPELWPPLPAPAFSESFNRSRALFLLLSGLLLAASALEPRFGTRPVPVPVAERPLILLLDVSPSMAVRDAPGSRLETGRLMARRVLARTPGVPVALGIFAGDAQMVLPPTSDHALVMGTMDSAGPSPFVGRGTGISPALEMVLEGIHGGTGGDGIGVLVLSDGEDFGSRDRARELAREIRGTGGWVSTLTLGSETGGVVPAPAGGGGGLPGLMSAAGGAEAGGEAFSRADPAYLAQVALAGGGVAARAESVPEVMDLLAFLEEWSAEQARGVSMEERPVDGWPLFLGLAIAGLALEAILDQMGYRRRKVGVEW